MAERPVRIFGFGPFACDFTAQMCRAIAAIPGGRRMLAAGVYDSTGLDHMKQARMTIKRLGVKYVGERPLSPMIYEAVEQHDFCAISTRLGQHNPRLQILIVDADWLIRVQGIIKDVHSATQLVQTLLVCIEAKEVIDQSVAQVMASLQKPSQESHIAPVSLGCLVIHRSTSPLANQVGPDAAMSLAAHGLATLLLGHERDAANSEILEFIKSLETSTHIFLGLAMKTSGLNIPQDTWWRKTLTPFLRWSTLLIPSDEGKHAVKNLLADLAHESPLMTTIGNLPKALPGHSRPIFCSFVIPFGQHTAKTDAVRATIQAELRLHELRSVMSVVQGSAVRYPAEPLRANSLHAVQANMLYAISWDSLFERPFANDETLEASQHLVNGNLPWEGKPGQLYDR